MNLKLLLSYDVKEHRMEDYYRFVMGEFLPATQQLGLVMAEGWQTVYGEYPSRLIGFMAEDADTLQRALQSDAWDSAETKLGEFITNYEKRLVESKPSFQFFKPSYRHQN